MTIFKRFKLLCATLSIKENSMAKIILVFSQTFRLGFACAIFTYGQVAVADNLDIVNGVITGSDWASGTIKIEVSYNDQRQCMFGNIKGHKDTEATLFFRLPKSKGRGTLIDPIKRYSRIYTRPGDDLISTIHYKSHNREKQIYSSPGGQVMSDSLKKGEDNGALNLDGILPKEIPGYENETLNDLKIELDFEHQSIRLLIPCLSYGHTRTSFLYGGRSLTAPIDNVPIWHSFVVNDMLDTEVTTEEEQGMHPTSLIEIEGEKMVDIQYLPDMPCPGVIKENIAPAKITYHIEIEPVPK